MYGSMCLQLMQLFGGQLPTTLESHCAGRSNSAGMHALGKQSVDVLGRRRSLRQSFDFTFALRRSTRPSSPTGGTSCSSTGLSTSRPRCTASWRRSSSGAGPSSRAWLSKLACLSACGARPPRLILTTLAPDYNYRWGLHCYTRRMHCILCWVVASGWFFMLLLLILFVWLGVLHELLIRVAGVLAIMLR